MITNDLVSQTCITCGGLKKNSSCSIQVFWWIAFMERVQNTFVILTEIY